MSALRLELNLFLHSQCFASPGGREEPWNGICKYNFACMVPYKGHGPTDDEAPTWWLRLSCIWWLCQQTWEYGEQSKTANTPIPSHTISGMQFIRTWLINKGPILPVAALTTCVHCMALVVLSIQDSQAFLQISDVPEASSGDLNWPQGNGIWIENFSVRFEQNLNEFGVYIKVRWWKPLRSTASLSYIYISMHDWDIIYIMNIALIQGLVGRRGPGIVFT